MSYGTFIGTDWTMARPTERLSPGKVAKATGPAGKTTLLADGHGLYLRIGPTGAKSWVLRYMAGRKSHDMGLGSLGLVGLREAREHALRQRRLLRLDGLDPIEKRRAERQAAMIEAASAMTFRRCAEAYIAAHKVGWKNPKHAAQWPSTLQTYVYPIFGNLPVQAVDVGLVTKAIEPIWATKPETASRVRGRIERVLDWATVRGYRQGENPARWRGHLEKLLPARRKMAAVEHHAALPYAELPAFMADLRQREGVAARALEFAVLTAARTGEVLGGRWSEIDLEGRLWTVPAGRMKKAWREHRVPLSEPALTILTGLDRMGDLVFPGQRRGRPLSDMALLMLLRRMGRGDLTAHGFRSTFSDWCAEETSFPSEVREMALAHTVGDKVEAAYRRGDLFEKRRQLAEAWARYCFPVASDIRKVVTIR
jgi:integrase